MNPVEMFCAMVVGHCLADYPLQSDFMARGKNRNTPIEGMSWRIILAAHSIIHGGFVWAITGNLMFGIAEAVAHAGIDMIKNDGKTSFATDQLIHIVYKLIWTIMYFQFVAA